MNYVTELVTDVDLQGDPALTLLELNAEYVIYKVVGNYSTRIIIRDFRKAGIAAINDVLNSGNRDDFPNKFPRIAKINIFDIKDAICISLSDTDEIEPRHTLYVLAGITEIPIHNYLFGRASSQGGNKYNMVGLMEND